MAAKRKKASKRAPAKKPPPRPRAREPRRPRGRPRVWPREKILEDLCAHIAADERNSVVSFGDKLAAEGGPDVRSLYRWIEEDPAFRSELQRAHRVRAARLVAKAFEIADYTAEDTEVRAKSNGEEYEVPNHEWMQRSKLRLDLRMRVAAQLDKETWSPHSEVKHEVTMSLEQILQRSRQTDEEDA